MIAPTLAQIPGLSSTPPVPPLPAPPLAARLLLESPWPLVIVLAAAAVVGFAVLRQLGKMREAVAVGAVGLGLACGVAMLGSSVVTARERLLLESRRLVGLVSRGETRGVGDLLASDVQATVLGAANTFDRDAILRRVEQDLAPGARFAVKNPAMLNASASIDGPTTGRTLFRLRVTVVAHEVPSFSWWMLHWRSEPSGQWKVTGIDVLEIDGMKTMPGL